jgi:hypothetical protein
MGKAKSRKRQPPTATNNDDNNGDIKDETFDQYYGRISPRSNLKQWLNMKNDTEYKKSLKRGWELWYNIIHKLFGVEYVEGNMEVLFLLLGTGNLTIAKIPWQHYSGDKKGELLDDEELQGVIKQFNENMFCDHNKRRNMVTTGPDPSYSNWTMQRMAGG